MIFDKNIVNFRRGRYLAENLHNNVELAGMLCYNVRVLKTTEGADLSLNTFLW